MTLEAPEHGLSISSCFQPPEYGLCSRREQKREKVLGGRVGWDPSLYTLARHKVTHVLIIISSGDFQSLPQDSLRWSPGPKHDKHTRQHGPHPQHVLPWTTPPTMSPRTTPPTHITKDHTFSCLQPSPQTTPPFMSFCLSLAALYSSRSLSCSLSFCALWGHRGHCLFRHCCLGVPVAGCCFCASALPGSISHCMNLSEAP